MDDRRFFTLEGQTAVVTGGAQGIGAGIAERLCMSGARIAVLDLKSVLARQSAEIPNQTSIECDVSSPEQVDHAFAEIRRHIGPIDILVNNAGIAGRTLPLWELSASDYDSVFAVNVRGIFLTSKAVIPGMLDRRYGRIVNIASIAGKEGNPTLGPYSASKAAVIALTKSLAKEVVGKGDITINSVAPGLIRTHLLDDLSPETVQYMISRIPMGRTGTIEEVAALVHYLASREASFTTGQCYDISGGRATY